MLLLLLLQVGWILSSEMFPTSVRGRAMAVSTVTRNSMEFLTNFLFLSTARGLSAGGTFALFAGCCALAFAFVRGALPETKDKDPAQILHDVAARARRAAAVAELWCPGCTGCPGCPGCGCSHEETGGCYHGLSDRLLSPRSRGAPAAAAEETD
jgi:hypothetical protein